MFHQRVIAVTQNVRRRHCAPVLRRQGFPCCPCCVPLAGTGVHPWPLPSNHFPIDSPQTFQIPAWLSTSVSNQCGREGNAAPRPQIFSEPIHWNPARARQEYFRPGMENGRISLQSGRTLALFICRRVSSIEQRQHCDSRIFYFLVSRAQPLALVVALAWVHQSSKTGIGVPDLVSSVRFWLTLPNDFQGMGSYDRFATET
jgi:hypothetical protein